MEELREFLFSIYVMLKFNHPDIIYEEFECQTLSYFIEFHCKSLIRIKVDKDAGKYLILIYGEPYYCKKISGVKKIISNNLEHVENILIDLEEKKYDR